jgi:predicted amidohydrolase YtcJ
MLRSSAAALRHHFADEGLAGFFPVRSALDAGCTVILNSDHPNGPAHPLEIIAAACTRRSDDTAVVDPTEAITVTQAVEMMTRRPYEVAGYSPLHGLVARGAPADLVALSEPLDRVPPQRLGDVAIRHTVVGGDVVWSAE